MAAPLSSHLFPIRASDLYCNRSYYFKEGFQFVIRCSDSTPPNSGFGPKSRNADNKKLKSSPEQSPTLPNRAPSLSSITGGERNYPSSDDLEFEQRLQAVRRSVLEQKKAEQEIGAIDYDAPTRTNDGKSGLGVQ